MTETDYGGSVVSAGRDAVACRAPSATDDPLLAPQRRRYPELAG
jgi:hypothetical protein